MDKSSASVRDIHDIDTTSRHLSLVVYDTFNLTDDCCSISIKLSATRMELG